MIGRLLAGVIVVALAIGVWALWPRGEPDPAPSTPLAAVDTTTTTSTSVAVTTTVAGITTITVGDSPLVAGVEEAEEILRELWYGWFEGIYHQDEARIKEVVGSQAALDNARDQFSVMEFSEPPSAASLEFRDTEILRSDDECLAVWAGIKADFRTGDTDGVHIIRVRGGDWIFVSLWVHQNDLWEADCDALLEPLS